MTTSTSMLRAWREEFVAAGPKEKQTGFTPLWEGKKAFSNLHAKGLIPLVILNRNLPANPGTFPARWALEPLLDGLMSEIRNYRREGGMIVTQQKEDKETMKALRDARRPLLKARNSCRIEENRRMLKQLSQDLLDGMAEISQRDEKRWRGGRLDGMLRPQSQKYPDREMDLDGWFQKNVGSIFRMSFPDNSGVSRRTVARLVMLVYLTADLAVIKHGYVISLAQQHEQKTRQIPSKTRGSKATGQIRKLHLDIDDIEQKLKKSEQEGSND